MKLFTIISDIIAVIGLLTAIGSVLYMAFTFYVPLGLLTTGICLFSLGIMLGGYIL